MILLEEVKIDDYTLALFQGGFIRVYRGDEMLAEAIPGPYGPHEGVSFDRYTGGYMPSTLTAHLCDLFVAHDIWEGQFPAI